MYNITYMTKGEKIQFCLDPFRNYLSEFFDMTTISKVDIKLLADIDSDELSFLFTKKKRGLLIFKNKNEINFLGITISENNKRILRKILGLTYDKDSYYDNTHNRIDVVEINIAIKSWLEKQIA